MHHEASYPLRFQPICQYRLWGGQRLAGLLWIPLPNSGPFGEAWLLSDRDDHASVVANGALKGQTLPQIMSHSRVELMGRIAQRFQRFPLLLKFLDARQMLSVQVHPGYTDGGSLPTGPQAKTEAWVVLEAGSKGRVYAGLKLGTTIQAVRAAVAGGSLPALMNLIHPKVGDAIFIPAGTVHSVGDDVVVFEIQQNRDTTFRLYDWGHIDSKTGKPRPLQVDQALAALDVTSRGAGRIHPVIEISGSPKQETRAIDKAALPGARTLDLDRESIWISHCAMTLGDSEPFRLPLFTSHKRLASPVNAWERLKIGAGTPPVLTPHGWLIVYHGVSDLTPASLDDHRLCYSAGIMVLSKGDPSVCAEKMGVSVNDGVVALDGHVGSLSQNWAAERAALRVANVTSVASEIIVDLPVDDTRTDADIAYAATSLLTWSKQVPDPIKVKGSNGWVTLMGTADPISRRMRLSS